MIAHRALHALVVEEHACALPLLIGLRTLALLSRSPSPYLPGSLHKVPRAEVRSLVGRSALLCLSNRRLDRLYSELVAGIVVA